MSNLWLMIVLVIAAVVTIQGVVLLALLRAIAGVHQRLEEQETTLREQEAQGSDRLVPNATLNDQQIVGLGGDTIELSRLWSRGNLLLLFVSVNCVPCRSLLTWAGDAFRNGQFSDWDVCILCAGQEAQARELFEEVGFPLEIPAAAVEYAALRSQYHILGTPTLAVVEENGHVIDVVAGEVEPYLNLLSRRSQFQVPA